MIVEEVLEKEINKDLVSVIIPMYNVEKYIKKCLDSILNQTYSNIEVIVIDNASSDSGVRIVKKICESDSRVVFLENEKTYRVGYSRNRGMDYAKGEYIWFVDADDYADNNFLEIMLKEMKANNVNIVQCCYRSFNDFNEYKDYLPFHQKQIFSGYELCKIMNQFIGLAGPNIMVWNKLYRRKILKDVRYYEGTTYEDMFFTYKVLYQQERILWIPDRLMNWRINANSATSKYNYRDVYLDEIHAYIERINFFDERHEQELKELVMKRLYYISTQHLYLYGKFIEDRYDVKKKQKWLVGIIKELYPKLIKMNRWSFRTKLRMRWIRYFPKSFGYLSVTYKLNLEK